ncbi:hypothetical protein C7964_102742 [Loktanella sp. PT4BL]|jgi:hypothetical protein|uniref:hypothetical protein n=1 Tax=Loktanella sp. PT4BL TaxID=2135611 RepID=UPI000D9AE154|nr:hypothetical protein [Loktanella sp. PT4BL]PXW70843.1 hypothetical protein C7964_102742 [Loktanella sp. PT4BL]
MIAAATIMTQLFLSAAALTGLFVLQTVLTRRDRDDPINRRFLFGVRVTMVLFAGRALMILTGIEAFRILTLLGAAIIPLAVLILTEGLLRRHAPPLVKAVIGGGAVVFAVSSLWYSGSIDPARLFALLGFQLLGFVLSGWLIISRDKASLSVTENAMVVRLGLSLILFIPLAAGDFLLLSIGLPIQFSALGVLILCWLAIGLGRPHLGHRATLVNLAVMVGAACGVGAMIAAFAQLGRDGYLLSIAAIMTTLFVVAILNDARALRLEEQSVGLLRQLAVARTDDPMTFLRDLQDHPLVEGAVVVSEESLQGLQDDVLDRIFAAAPVLRRSDPPQLGPVADDHIAYLFARYSATHVMLAASRPRVLVALAMPSLGASPSAELELQIVQRMAALIAMRKGDRDEG